MPSGRPDWFGTIVSAGKYDTQFIPIAVDASGALVALLKGASVISGEVDVNQLDGVREVQGANGGGLVTFAVDASGALVALLKGTSLISGEVDVNQLDGVREVQGANEGGLVTIAVDASGKILSVMKGDYSGALKTLLPRT